MLTGALWFVLLLAAGLAYPRHPRASGILFIALGGVSIANYSLGNGLGAASGIVMAGLGVRYLVKYRDPAARARHLDYWTAKA